MQLPGMTEAGLGDLRNKSIGGGDQLNAVLELERIRMEATRKEREEREEKELRRLELEARLAKEERERVIEREERRLREEKREREEREERRERQERIEREEKREREERLERQARQEQHALAAQRDSTMTATRLADTQAQTNTAATTTANTAMSTGVSAAAIGSHGGGGQAASSAPSDPDRKAYEEWKEQRRLAEEAERARLEAERIRLEAAEAERRRIAEEKAAEQKRLEEEKAAEQKRLEEEKARQLAEAERVRMEKMQIAAEAERKKKEEEHMKKLQEREQELAELRRKQKETENELLRHKEEEQREAKELAEEQAEAEARAADDKRALDAYFHPTQRSLHEPIESSCCSTGPALQAAKDQLSSHMCEVKSLASGSSYGFSGGGDRLKEMLKEKKSAEKAGQEEFEKWQRIPVDNDVRIWKVDNKGKFVHSSTMRGHSDPVHCITTDELNTAFATASYDGTIRLYSRSGSDFHFEACLTGHHAPVNGISMTRFQPLIMVSGGSDMSVKIWDVETTDIKATMEGHQGAVNAVAINYNGTMCASGSNDKTCRLWDLKTFSRLAILAGHTGAVYSVAINRPGTLMASGSKDKTIRLWSTSTFQCLTICKGHSGPVTGLAFTPDSTTIMSAGDNTARTWSTDAKEMAGFVSGMHGASAEKGQVLCVIPLQCGTKAIAGNKNGALSVWHFAA